MRCRQKVKRRVESQRYADFPAVSAAIQYAEQVVSGDIPAGRMTRLACQRQIDDLNRDWEYTFDAEDASRVCQVVEFLPHTKGKWAQKKERIALQPWQQFMFTTLFGWKRANGSRRFRHAYVCVPRKSGKSLIAAAVGIYMLAFDRETGAEVYCGATSEKQAWEVFKPARMMILKTPELEQEIGIEPLARSLVISDDGAKFEPIIGDPGDGSSPSMGIVDEYHEHKTPVQYDTLVSGMGARDQPLMFVITTAGAIHGGPCYEHQRDVERVLEGSVENDEQFGLIYHADADDDWTDPEVLRKANPGYGVSVSGEYLLARQRDAIVSAQRQNLFRTKHLNQWVTAKEVFFNMDKWMKCADSSLSIDQFEGSECMIAIDLASKSDVAAVMRMFWRDEDGMRHYYAFPRFYLPEERVHQDATGRYKPWVLSGLLTTTDGDEIDFARIREDVIEDLSAFDVAELPFDPWRATQLAQDLAAAGATTVEYRNTVAQMSEPMKELEAAVNSGRFHFDGNDMLSWMATNTVAKIDANQNVFPRKERPENKIDGIVACIMSIGRLLYRATTEQPNVYQSRGLRYL